MIDLRNRREECVITGRAGGRQVRRASRRSRSVSIKQIFHYRSSLERQKGIEPYHHEPFSSPFFFIPVMNDINDKHSEKIPPMYFFHSFFFFRSFFSVSLKKKKGILFYNKFLYPFLRARISQE